MPRKPLPSSMAPIRLQRRACLQLGGLAAAAWLTPLAEILAQSAESSAPAKPARSVIVLWLAGGPSQLETFDPHAGASIAGGTGAIKTRVPEIELATGYEQLAEQMDVVSLVRSVVSKEGDHERATYNMKTGYRPDPTLVHPALGAILCHQLKDEVEIPRHVSILPGQWPARGGYLGDQFDAFKVDDPLGPIPDVRPLVPMDRFQRRVDDLFGVVESEFARGRLRDLDRRKTLHGLSTRAATRMMTSEQLKAFDIKQEPADLRTAFGNTPFGNGCLAALRLIEVGVRCVEVTLGGWDSHVNNHEIHTNLAKTLDPAFATLLKELRRRERLEETLVICAGEFGRTPKINPAGGRDHWPHGFTVALAGGGIPGGRVIGATSHESPPDDKPGIEQVVNAHTVADIHATVLNALGVEYAKQMQTPVGRPMALSEGSIIAELQS